MIKHDDPILIIGAGSIGERHIRNLLSLGYHNLVVYRQRNLAFRTIGANQVKVVTNFAEALSLQPEVAFITSPTAQHLSQAIACAESGMHLFIEKPLSHTPEGLEQLKETVARKGIYLYVGYMMRFHPLVRELKEIIRSERFGKLLSFTTRWGEYLPDWHPWEDYRTSYAARKELGGGAALTLSHDLDLVLWLNDVPLDKYYALPNFASLLEVDVEGGIDFLLRFVNGVTGHVHLNFFEKPPCRYMHFVFEGSAVHFDYYASALRVYSKAGNNSDELPNFDRNQLFVDQTIHFFNQLKTFRPEDSLQNIEDSARIIGMCRQA